MSSPKRPLPEQVATQIATTLPGGSRPDPHASPGPGGPADRRTAALPQAPVPLSAPHDRTMTFDPSMLQPPQRRAALQTVMSMPQAVDDPPRARRPGNGRWVGGPLLAVGVGVLTAWLAGVIAGPPAKRPMGHLRLSSDPEGATVLVEGKVQPHPTPTLIEGEVGATMHVGFRLDGYIDKEADVFVGEGERPFRAKLDSTTAPHGTGAQAPDDPIDAPPPIPKTDDNPRPRSLAPTPQKEDHGHAKKEPRHERTSVPPSPVATGSGTLSVHVRPWAIVYVDGAKIRQTPVDNYSITAGIHVVELVNEGLRKKEKVTVEVRNHGTEEVRRDWEK
ncbi:MAG: PEGA domain-containing protein [Polyangia bacterium]